MTHYHSAAREAYLRGPNPDERWDAKRGVTYCYTHRCENEVDKAGTLCEACELEILENTPNND